MARKYKCKEFELSDGTTHTARTIADKYNVPLSTTRTRLSMGVRDIEVLSKPPAKHKQNKYRNVNGESVYVPTETVKERVAKRNYYDPLSRLLLKTI